MSNKLIKSLKVRKGDLIKKLNRLEPKIKGLIQDNELQPLINVHQEILQNSRGFDELHFRLLEIDDIKDNDLEVEQRDKFQTDIMEQESLIQKAIQSINKQIEEKEKEKEGIEKIKSINSELRSILNELENKTFTNRDILIGFRRESEDLKNKFHFHLKHVKMLEIDETENKDYFDTIKIQEIINKINANCYSILDGLNSSRDSSQNGNKQPNDDSQCKIKLPKIDVPSFSGLDHEDWLTFKNLFQQLIHDNKSLSNLEKYKYLVSSLKGDALNAIKNFQMTEESYEDTWKTLCHRYHNVRKLVFSQIHSLFSMPKINNPTPNKILKLHDALNNFVKAMTFLDCASTKFSDTLLIYIMQSKLDADTKEWWDRYVREKYPSKTDIPTVKDLLSFLERQSESSDFSTKPTSSKVHDNFKRLETSSHQKVSNLKPHVKKVAFSADKGDAENNIVKQRTLNKGQSNSSEVKATSSKNLFKPIKNCRLCNNFHSLYFCPQFRQRSIQDKNKYVVDNGLCFNCLGENHAVANCLSRKSCFTCGSRHNTLLHKNEDSKSEMSNQFSSVDSMSNFVATKEQEVLLFTALIKVKNVDGVPQTCRAILDYGSQASLISTDCFKRLKLRSKQTNMMIRGVTGECVNKYQEVQLQFGAHFENNQNFQVSAVVMSEFNKTLPQTKLFRENWPKEIILADPQYFMPSRIDILLGMDAYCQITSSSNFFKIKNLIAVETELGFVVGGKSRKSKKLNHTVLDSNFTCSDVNFSLQSFWELDSVPNVDQRSPEDEEAEIHFKNNFERTDEGRYQVRLPFRSNIKHLGNSKFKAHVQLRRILTSLQKNSHVFKMYNDFFKEYLSLSHMERLPKNLTETSESNSYYLPHHHVLREDKVTTKLRVVFNASAKTSSGVSLNDNLLQGPVVQDSLFAILLRFRIYPVAFVSDIEKMYRQVLVHPDDQKFQRILWTSENEGKVEEFQLKTLTYGFAPAAFLATRSLIQLAIDERNQFPEASEVVKTSFYVDDLLSGHINVESAKILIKQLDTLLKKGGFTLRKWCSNDPKCLEDLNLESEKVEPITIFKDKIKTLGILWNFVDDEFQFNISEFDSQAITKRSILSYISKVFDPLGWISPIILVPKLFIQVLWKRKISWDQPISEALKNQWGLWLNELNYLKNISISRCIFPRSYKAINLHCFADASEKAYAAVIYISIITEEGKIITNLLTAKTKLAPIKQRTIPLLELCGCFLLAKLVKATVISLKLLNFKLFAWTDSTIVLDWLKSNKKLEIFVSNRKNKILSVIPIQHWKHVAGINNPADIASRGSTSKNLGSSNTWWKGPEFLNSAEYSFEFSNEEHYFNYADFSECTNLQSYSNDIFNTEAKQPTSSNDQIDNFYFIKNCSTLNKLLKCQSYLFRWYKWFKNEVQVPIFDPVTTEETNEALFFLIFIVQKIEFSRELKLLKNGKTLPKGNSLKDLNLFIDDKGLLRVGGRLSQSNLNFNQAHQILLPKNHCLTDLVIKELHERHIHGGPQLIISSFRNLYWSASLRSQVKRIIHKCFVCVKFRAKTLNQQMSQLPADRVIPSPPFFKCGVDLAGPFFIKTMWGRVKSKQKIYVVLFVCFTTKAIHLEFVSNLSTKAFLCSLRRFVSRRGKPNVIYSDNGTNFVGANKELLELFKHQRIIYKDKIFLDHIAKENLNWKFIPPLTPHFGGLWEAGIKSFKFHFKRVVGNTILNLDEFSTLLSQIEAILNSRPIVAIYDSVDEPMPLTPGHFLIGRPLTAIPNPLLNNKGAYTNRWISIQHMVKGFWDKWSSDYLSLLQQRTKWNNPKRNLCVNDVVLIKEDNLPTSHWQIGLVNEVYPGKDGLVRVASLKTKRGIIKRGIDRLVLLPVQQ